MTPKSLFRFSGTNEGTSLFLVLRPQDLAAPGCEFSQATLPEWTGLTWHRCGVVLWSWQAGMSCGPTLAACLKPSSVGVSHSAHRLCVACGAVSGYIDQGSRVELKAALPQSSAGSGQFAALKIWCCGFTRARAGGPRVLQRVGTQRGPGGDMVRRLGDRQKVG